MQTKSTYKKFVAIVAGLALVVLALPPVPVAHAQDAYGAALGRLLKGYPVLTGVGADDTDVALVVRYVGTGTNGGTVAVAAGGDLTFSVGAVGASAVSTTFECPVSGALGGIIDVSDAACDTLGEVVDIINTSTSDFRAAIVAGIRTDSSNDTLLTISETAANGVNGLQLAWDTSTAFMSSLLLGPTNAGYMPWYYQSRQSPVLKSNPFAGTRPILFLQNGTSTYASGTSNFTIYCIAVTNGYSGTAAETVTTYATPAGATTANKILDFSPYGISCPNGQKMVARILNSAAAASTVHYIAGVLADAP